MTTSSKIKIDRCIYKLPNGRYQAHSYDALGKERSKTFDKLTDARAYRAEMCIQKRKGDLPTSASRTTFQNYAEVYLVQKLSLRRRTRDKYQAELALHLLPAFGPLPLARISRLDVQQWVVNQVRTGLSPETVRGHFSLLTAIFNRAVVEDLLAKSPCTSIELPRVRREEKRFLTAEQVEALVQAAPDPYKVLIYAAAYLGCRWQELSGLRRANVSIPIKGAPTIRIVTTVERSNGVEIPVEMQKSRAALRTLELPSFLAQAMANHLHEFSASQWAFPAPQGGFLRCRLSRTRDHLRGSFLRN
ncbi:MAG: tyrosine-type recombinase/integrase [Actinomycetota bacterium]